MSRQRLVVERARQERPRLDDPALTALWTTQSGRKEEGDLGPDPPPQVAEGHRDLDFRIPHTTMKSWPGFVQILSWSGLCHRELAASWSDLGGKWPTLQNVAWNLQIEVTVPPGGPPRGGRSQIAELFRPGGVVKTVTRGTGGARPILTSPPDDVSLEALLTTFFP